MNYVIAPMRSSIVVHLPFEGILVLGYELCMDMIKYYQYYWLKFNSEG